MIFFKVEETNLSRSNLKSILFNSITRELNKGHILSWIECLEEMPKNLTEEDFQSCQDYHKELSEFDFLKKVIEIEAFEYLFHSPKKVQIISKNFGKMSTEIPLLDHEWQLCLEILSVRYRQNWNIENPFCSFFIDLFGKKFRASMIHHSTSPTSRSKLILRSIQSAILTLSDFGASDVLKNIMKMKANILIAGATSSGKTTLLSSLLGEIPKDEHLIILEDTFEIQAISDHVTRFLSGEGEKNSLKSYLSYCLRLTPDRLIVGEMRSHEVIPYLLAMNTGLKGLLSTIHSSSAADAIARLGMLFSLYHNQDGLNYDTLISIICKNLDYVIYMEDKKVKEIIRIIGSERGTPYFESLGISSNF